MTLFIIRFLSLIEYFNTKMFETCKNILNISYIYSTKNNTIMLLISWIHIGLVIGLKTAVLAWGLTPYWLVSKIIACQYNIHITYNNLHTDWVVFVKRQHIYDQMSIYVTYFLYFDVFIKI